VSDEDEDWMSRTQLGADTSDDEPELAPTKDHSEEALLLKIGGFAQHLTLGKVTIMTMGPLGCSVEYVSGNSNELTTRRSVMLCDLQPLADPDTRTSGKRRAANMPGHGDDDPLEVLSHPHAPPSLVAISDRVGRLL
jgi:hypothetical protein